MANLTNFTKPGTRFQDVATLILGALLFLSPWALGYADAEMAARTAWISGAVIALLAIAALVNFAEWEEWVNLLVGLAVIASPYLFGFANVAHAVTTHYVLGVLVVLLTGWELWEVHHPTPRMM